MEYLLKDGLLDQTAFRFDDTSDIIFGYYKGYHIHLTENNEDQITISCSVVRDAQGPDRDFLRDVKSFGNQSVNGVSAKGFKVTAMAKGGMTKQKRSRYVVEAIDDLVDYFAANNFVDCCEQTGQTDGVEIYAVSGSPMILSPMAFEQIRTAMEDEQLAETSGQQPKENVFAGIVGALLGSLIGVALIVAISQLGYVVWISGLAMGVCTVKGYEFLAKRYSIKGAIICLVIVVGMTYFANELDWAVTIVRNSDLDIFTAFQTLPSFKSLPDFPQDTYWINLALIAVSSLVVAIPTIFGALSDSKNRYTIRQLSLEADEDDDY